MNRLNDVFKNWITDGIFTYLTDTPWRVSDNNILNLQYHGNHSGNKIVSPIVNNLTENDVLSTENKTQLGNVITTMFGQRWNKLYATLSLEYNPIENYKMIETEQATTDTNATDMLNGSVVDATTDNNILTCNTQVSHEQNDTSEVNHNTVDADAIDKTTTVNGTGQNNMFGFNSTSSVPSETNTSNGSTKETGTNTVTHTGTDDVQSTNKYTDTNSGSDTTTNKHDSTVMTDNTNEHTGKEQNERTMTRSGNIGVTTSQQMIQSERELWNWVFFEQVFNDIDTILTLSIY